MTEQSQIVVANTASRAIIVAYSGNMATGLQITGAARFLGANIIKTDYIFIIGFYYIFIISRDQVYNSFSLYHTPNNGFDIIKAFNKNPNLKS